MRLPHLILCLVTLIVPSLCVSQDDIFKVDWQNTQIGLPLQSTSLGSNSLVSDSIIQFDDKFATLTHDGIFALFQSTTGQLTYRFQADQPIKCDSKIVKFGNRIVTAFNYDIDIDKSELYFWILANGVVLIEKSVAFESSVVGSYVVQDKLLLVLANGDILSFSEDLTSTSLESEVKGNYCESILFKSTDGDLVVALGDTSTGSYVFKVITHEFQISKEGNLGCDIYSMTSISDDAFICGNDKLFEYKDGDFVSRKLGKGKDDRKVLIFSTNYLTYKESKLIDSESKKELELDSQVTHIDKIGDRVVVLTKDSVSLLDADSIQSGPLATIKLALEIDDVLSYVINVVDNSNFELLVLQKSYTITYYNSNGDSVWTRDESLAYVVDYCVIEERQTVDLTVDDLKFEYSSNVVVGIITRLKHNFASLVGKISSLSKETFESSNLESYFGLNKSLIILTANGKLISLATLKDANHNQVTWKFDTGLEGNADKLYLVQKDQSDLLIVSSSTGEYYEVAPFTNTMNLIDDVSEYFIKIQTPDGDSKLILKDDPLVGDESFFFQVSDDEKSLVGYTLSHGEQKKTWVLNLSSDEVVLNVATREYENDHVSNIGIVLGDRKVLYKYLVPDLAVVSIYSTSSQVLKTQLINIITGEVYKSLKNEDITKESAETLQLIFTENSIIYSMIDTKTTNESNVYVIDLFESLTPDLKQTNSMNTISHLNSSVTFLPELSIRSYLLTGKVLKFAVTRTKFNISSKFIIAYLENKEILAIPQWFLSGRRVVNRDLNADEKQEFRMLKYDPVISLNEKFIINHYRTLMKAHNSEPILISLASNLESTSIVCSIGLDTFCTQVRPSGTFDHLSSTFNKKSLIATIVLITVATLVSRPYVSNKKLTIAWQTNL